MDSCAPPSDVWQHLPESVLFAHILSRCPIDTRIALMRTMRLNLCRRLWELPPQERPPFDSLEACTQKHLQDQRRERDPILMGQAQVDIPIHGTSKLYAMVKNYMWQHINVSTRLTALEYPQSVLTSTVTTIYPTCARTRYF